MGKIYEQKVTDFSGGITDDPRSTKDNVALMVSNFDALLNSRRLIPYRDTEAGDEGSTTSKKQAFCIALRTGTTYSLYALGVGASAEAEIQYKNLTTGSANDLDDDDWTSTANNLAASGTTSFNLFVYYKKTGYIYGATSGTHVWRYDPSGGGAFVQTHQALTYTTISQGLVHSKDDILYIPYDNKVAKNDNGSWTTAALTLPSHLYITSIAEHGSYLAIACAPLSGFGSSRVFLWDRDSTLATLSESIDWGSGILQVLDEVDGVLIGINVDGEGTSRFNSRIVFRYLSVSNAIKFKEYVTGSASATLSIAKQRIDNRLYFLMSATVNGAIRSGLWSVGREQQSSPFTVVHELTQENDTALGGGALKGFYVHGDYRFISYVNNGGAYSLSKTNDTASYTATSIYEGKIFNGGDSSITKKLIGITVMFEYLPAAGSVTVKYRKDSETSYTPIGTQTADAELSASFVNIASSGANLPEFKEVTFRIESTGGAVITGYSFAYEAVEKRPYTV